VQLHKANEGGIKNRYHLKVRVKVSVAAHFDQAARHNKNAEARAVSSPHANASYAAKSL
jgi:hypothetical protein